jgi:protease II
MKALAMQPQVLCLPTTAKRYSMFVTNSKQCVPTRCGGIGSAAIQIGVASSSFPNDNEANLQPASTVLRFRFSGPLQPECIYDFDVSKGSLSFRKQDRAISWFNPNQYTVDRRYAIASDGETVPITIVYRKDLRRAAGNPVLIMGYGAYGSSHAVNLHAVCC